MLFNTELPGRISASHTLSAKPQKLGLPLDRIITGENTGTMRPRIPSHPINAKLTRDFRYVAHLSKPFQKEGLLLV